MGRGRIHLLGQRAEGNAARLQVFDSPDQIRELAARTTELPYDQDVPGSKLLQASFQPCSIIAGAGGFILVKMTIIDPGGDERIALKVD